MGQVVVNAPDDSDAGLIHPHSTKTSPDNITDGLTPADDDDDGRDDDSDKTMAGVQRSRAGAMIFGRSELTDPVLPGPRTLNCGTVARSRTYIPTTY